MRRNLVLALLGGLLAALAFPNPCHPGLDWSGGWLAWLCLVPLLAVRDAGPRPWHYWRWGLVYGAAYFGLSILWLAQMRAMAPLGPLVWLLLTAYLALYPAAFLAGYRWLLVRGVPGWSAAAVWWVSLEYLRTYLLTGFPWVALGYAHFRNPWLLSLAPVTGVYGLSLLTVLVNAGLYAGVSRWLPAWRGPEAGLAPARTPAWRWLGLGLVLALMLGGALWEQARQRQEPPAGRLPMAALQGNIDQDQPWDDRYRALTLTTFRSLGEVAAAQGARVLVWPESAFPGIFNWDQSLALEVRSWSRRWGVWQVVGADTVSAAGRGFRYFNSAVLLTPAGEVAAVVSKLHLVPFGEYVPFKDSLLFFIRKLVERYGVGDYSPGPERVPLRGQAGGETIAAGVLICFESLFPDEAAELVRRGATCLLVITNDAWFGATAAPAQHALFSALRAAENGRDLVRVGATGISCAFDRHGRLQGLIPLRRAGYLPVEVRLYRGWTLYTRCGPWLAWLCLLVVVLELALRRPAAPRA